MFKDKPQHNGYSGMNQCHGEVISMAKGHGVLFLPPDCVPSVNLFQEVKRSTAEGKKLVMVCCLRTFGNTEVPEEPERLNSWAVDWLHPNMKGWIWGHSDGIDLIPSNIFFRNGDNFWCHAAHLHPVAAVLDRKVGGGKSIDSYLAGAYTQQETWVVENCEIALAEITAENKFAGLKEAPISVHSCVKRLAGKLHKHNKEFMLHAVRLRGEIGETPPVITEILKGLKD